MSEQICAACGNNTPKHGFSNRQLKKFKKMARCKGCINTGATIKSPVTVQDKVTSSPRIPLSPKNPGHTSISAVLSRVRSTCDSKPKSQSGYSSESNSSQDSTTSSETIDEIFGPLRLQKPITAPSKPNPATANRSLSNKPILSGSRVSFKTLNASSNSTTSSSKRKSQATPSSQISSKKRKLNQRMSSAGSEQTNRFIPSNQAKRVAQAGDGNCLYRSLLFGLSKSSGKKRVRSHQELRQKLAAWVLNNAKKSVNGAEISKWIKWEKNLDVRRYYERQRNSGGAWGGQIELCACSNVFDVVVNVFEWSREKRMYKQTTSFKPESRPNSTANVNVLYVDGNHYDALVLRA